MERAVERRVAAVGAVVVERGRVDDAHPSEEATLAGPRLPENVTSERAQLARQTQVAIGHFNHAVARYNAAIDEFPALLLAWLFGFKPGRGLRAH